ncbi:MAG: DNA translocase FtsK, partial [Planctomycetota bacterium]
GGYEMPRIELLKEYEPVQRLSDGELQEGSRLLENKLLDFGVKGNVTKVHTGPVVTMYEFEPAPGVKINRVVSLSDDLALALKAQSIRISTLPGKAAIGIEIPNNVREIASLRDTVSSDAFTKSASKLTIALGKDIFGVPVVADLARMPHLLVAGATGAGKSVALNSMILSLLYKARPDEVKVLLIDPKLLEFSAYEGVPHLISQVVTNPKEAAEMLRKMVFEMERRYRLIASKGVRNIESFNAASGPDDRLPYIVIFIDELADLMFASGSQVEDSIARLAQMARASGMHLVLATQRPSVDVITGIIKANFPARIAFQVTTRVDSRTIIDTQGAEQLVGKGDMLFMLPGKRIMRVHGTLVTETEIRDIIQFVKAQGAPDYTIVDEINRVQQEAIVEQEYSEDRDETYQKAIDHAEAMGEVSISSIQRRLKIGYNKAARMMEMMEEDGLVGPPKGAGKPRDFLGQRKF